MIKFSKIYNIDRVKIEGIKNVKLVIMNLNLLSYL